MKNKIISGFCWLNYRRHGSASVARDLLRRCGGWPFSSPALPTKSLLSPPPFLSFAAPPRCPLLLACADPGFFFSVPPTSLQLRPHCSFPIQLHANREDVAALLSYEEDLPG